MQQNYKPFDLKKALDGAEVIDDLGNLGKYMFTATHHGEPWHVFKFIINCGLCEYVTTYCEKSGAWVAGFSEDPLSGRIFMASVKREVWVNVYTTSSGVWPQVAKFRSEDEARKGFPDELGEYLKSIKIHEYEE